MDEVKQRLASHAKRINDRRPSTGSTPLIDAAFRGNLEIVKLLLDRGAKVNATNRDGNTPLIAAAFMCRTEVVRLLLDQGASVNHKNELGETVLEILSRPWNEELARFYTDTGNSTGVKGDLDRIKQERPNIVKLLREHNSK
ncbi:MAG: ankyrin repeat domain-containing protein [Pirellulaceae bacterium]|nr:ankyrin repeat domain-containing protein [Pirellulaceae bacterium]